MTSYQVVARNFSEASENKIHSDEIAQKYGFKGALVPGVAVYGHLTLPLVSEFGAEWLENSVGSVRLLKPAYQNDRLTLSLDPADDGGYSATCRNEDGELLAVLTSRLGDLPDPEYVDRLAPPYKSNGRVEIAWDTIELWQAFSPGDVELSRDVNDQYVDHVADPLPIYKDDGYVHPHLIQALANGALTREYVMPAWIHVGTETRHRAALKTGDRISIRSVPIEKWRKKGHEFIRLWVTFWRGDELTTDMLHTAIYKVAD